MDIDNIKVGDYVYCRETGYMKNTDHVFAYKGEQYLVEWVCISEGQVELHTERGSGHLWTINELFHEYFSDTPQSLTKHVIKKHKLI
tara:strand:+ start:847 stop:1107 length:261 start_codon:yes stop_codon:yes gene_type:complete